jgi:hypothetical protein
MLSVFPHLKEQEPRGAQAECRTPAFTSGSDPGHNERISDFACADTFAHSCNNAQMESRPQENIAKRFYKID